MTFKYIISVVQDSDGEIISFCGRTGQSEAIRRDIYIYNSKTREAETEDNIFPGASDDIGNCRPKRELQRQKELLFSRGKEFGRKQPLGRFRMINMNRMKREKVSEGFRRWRWTFRSPKENIIRVTPFNLLEFTLILPGYEKRESCCTGTGTVLYCTSPRGAAPRPGGSSRGYLIKRKQTESITRDDFRRKTRPSKIKTVSGSYFKPPSAGVLPFLVAPRDPSSGFYPFLMTPFRQLLKNRPFRSQQTALPSRWYLERRIADQTTWKLLCRNYDCNILLYIRFARFTRGRTSTIQLTLFILKQFISHNLCMRQTHNRTLGTCQSTLPFINNFANHTQNIHRYIDNINITPTL